MSMDEKIARIINLLVYSDDRADIPSRLVSFCANDICKRENKTGINTFLLSESLHYGNFDRRTISYNLFLIGISFINFSQNIDFLTLPFADDEELFNEFLKETIKIYLVTETKAINKSDSTFAINIMKSVIFQNTKAGYEAEENVLNIIKRRYEYVLPLMEEVTKKAQRAKKDNQAGLFSE